MADGRSQEPLTKALVALEWVDSDFQLHDMTFLAKRIAESIGIGNDLLL